MSAKGLISYVNTLEEEYEKGKISRESLRGALCFIVASWLSYRGGDSLYVDRVDWEITSYIFKVLPRIIITIDNGYTTFNGKRSPQITIPSSNKVKYVYEEYTPPAPYMKVRLDVRIKDVEVAAAVTIVSDVHDTLEQIKERKKVLEEIFKNVTHSISMVL